MKDNNDREIADLLFNITKVRINNQLDTTAVLQSRLANAAAKKNIQIFRNESGELIGYAAWATVSRETLNFVLKTRQLPILPYEWHDGKIKLIFDVVFSRDWALLSRYHFFSYLRKHRFFAYYKNNRAIVCQHKYSRSDGYFWQYKRLNSTTLRLIK